jgi:hypothetical protein
VAWNIRTSRQVGVDLEIFKFPPNAQGFASIVLDATAVASGSDGSRKLLAGTALIKDGVTNQYKKYAGTGTIKGILAHPVEFADGTVKSDKDAAIAFHGEVFRADRIVDFVTHGAAIRAALPTCRFD